jgi:chorismate mutase
MRLLVLTLLVWLWCSTPAHAQDSKKPETNSREYENTFDPSREEAQLKSLKARRRYQKLYEEYEMTYGQLIEEYEQRMKAVAKQKKKGGKNG